MGADIIIGVDVQSGLYSRDELNSMVRVMDQVVTFYRVEASNEAIEMTDIYIKPDVNSFDIMSFTQHDSIIMRGENRARQFMGQLIQLADSLNQIAPREANTLQQSHLILFLFLLPNIGACRMLAAPTL